MLRLWVSAVRVAQGLAICAAGSLASQTQVPPASASRLEAVRGLLAAGNYAVAEQSLLRVLVEDPSLADAHFLLGFALLHEGKATESLAEYTEGAKFGEPGADDLAAVASDYVLLKDFADADRWLRAALQRAPTRAQLWYLLGRTQYNENRWADAEHSFLECLRREPRHVRAEYNLGLVYEAEQRPAKAEEAYQTAIGWEGDPPEDIQPHLDWGMLLRRQGKIAKALPLPEDGPENGRDAGVCGGSADCRDADRCGGAECEGPVGLQPGIVALFREENASKTTPRCFQTGSTVRPCEQRLARRDLLDGRLRRCRDPRRRYRSRLCPARRASASPRPAS